MFLWLSVMHKKVSHPIMKQTSCPISLTVGRTRIRSVVIDFGSRVFYFPMAPSQGGERDERLTNTLLGAKAGGQHRQERALASTSLRCTRRRCALATLSYDNMVSGPKFGTRILVQVPYCRSVAQLRRNVVSYDANSSAPMCATDDDVLHVWRQAAYL